MNVDLETLCKTYLMFMDDEFCDNQDHIMECREKKRKAELLQFFSELSEKEAENDARTFREGMMEGYLTVVDELRRLINIELGNEIREFDKSRGYICPNCNDGSMTPECEYIPMFDGYFNMSYNCPKCGFSREFPKHILVKDIITEYANKQKEKEVDE